MNNLTRSLVLLFMSPLAIFSQKASNDWPASFFSGYDKTLHGGGFIYHSPKPGVTSSMLIRSIDSSDYIEWTTANVPADFTGDYASFIWMFGIDANEGSHQFDLSVNGTRLLSFNSPTISSKDKWTVEGTDGAQLVFIPTLIDQYNDLMGFVILRLPLSHLKSGQQQIIRVAGEEAGSRAWYMTFESPIGEEVEINQVEAVTNSGGKLYDVLEFEFVHLGVSTSAVVTIPGGISRQLKIEPGYNSYQVEIPEVDRQIDLSGTINIDGKTIRRNFRLTPVRKWTIYMVEHTHTDVGYTRPQDEILPAHLRYIDEALDYCDQTDSFPDAAKFRWTCETAWAVREYLRTRPEKQIARLLARIKEGRIEVTGLFLNMSDMYDEPTLANLMETIKEFKQRDIPVTTGMQDDVNGAAWCLPDYLTSAGVKYFTMGQNVDRALEPFNRPTAFWWESPSGKRILAYRGEHYMRGDDLGILSGDIGTLSGNLFRYLKSLEQEGYPFDRAMLQFLGYYTDNAPPSIKACNLVRQWNEKYAWPKLELATISRYFDYIAANHAAELPTYKLAWPDWWIDGFGSGENETAHVRDTQAGFIANQGLLAMAELLGAKPKPALLDEVRTINESIAFYDEHSFGAAESISDPLSVNSTVQWNEKRAFAWDAFRVNGLLREEALGLLDSLVQFSDTCGITVFNTMSFSRSGVSTVFILNSILPPGKKFKIVDGNGTEIPAQLLATRAEGNYWAIYAKDVPAFGFSSYKIQVSDEPSQDYQRHDFHGKIENGFYAIEVDTAKGAIRSILDKAQNLELVDPGAPWELGEFIYETLPDRESIPRHAVNQLTRTSMKEVSVSKVIEGPIWTSLDVTGQVPKCADSSGITCEIRLYRMEKRIELVYSMKKKEVFSSEGAYVAFPFGLENGEISFEVQGGTVVPGKNQLPGSASDWDGVQNFVAIRSGVGQIVMSSPETPIMEFGDINLGKFQEFSSAEKPYIYSWVLNNYWTTNFPAAQEGGMEWRYEFTSSSDSSLWFATHFGWSSRVPLITAPHGGNTNASRIQSKSLLNFASGDPMLVSARPAWNGSGIVLCLREIAGCSTRVNVSNLLKSGLAQIAQEVSSLEEPIGEPSKEILFIPHEVKFILIR